MDKLKMHSPDLSQENIAKIRDVFPGCVTEARDEATGVVRLAVDFDQMRQELSDHIVEGPQERYRLDWPGKREALALANAPIAKTLRPCREESVDFDTTQNLFIEGDNLESLKILQENYLGKAKMIYIDPPYNTGGDFIYHDDFTESFNDFLQRSNQTDESGNRLVANPEANGRFHSDWLSMFYARAKLAKNLLASDGAFFTSIDDNEVHSCRAVLDEIFGTENFVNCIAVKMSEASGVKMSHITARLPKLKEYLLFYRKSPSLKVQPVTIPAQTWNEEYKDFLDDLSKQAVDQIKEVLEKDHPTEEDVKLIDSLLAPAKIISAKQAHKKYALGHDFEEWRQENSWRIIQAVGSGSVKNLALQRGDLPPQEVLTVLSSSGKLYLFKRNFNQETKSPRIQILFADQNIDQKAGDFWSDIKTTGGVGAEGGIIFPNGKKPLKLLRRILDLCTAAKEDHLVIDFFAGSSSTAHAVLEANAADGGNRKFLMVQLPEATDLQPEHRTDGLSTIAEVSKERIRRAGKKIREGQCHPDWNRDVGFRVFKVDTSNMKDVYYRPDELKQSDLLDMVDNVKEDRTSEDLLFQVLVDWGVDLTLPIRRETVQGKTVFFVDDNALVACFDRGVTEELVKELAKREPLRVVFRDNGFVSDAVKINVEQIFRQLSPSTDVKAI
ncbi:site-specific DNA-methyltransferase [Sphingobium yanoikuyae]|uniref:site-specific DNA-methyltransferase n=1 Tax=Sphingobium TaxID=165695 RepID=UPI0028A5D5EE|nr:site-specific DNA-methyltransferase [Sphingobium yanoikuyae]